MVYNVSPALKADDPLRGREKEGPIMKRTVLTITLAALAGDYLNHAHDKGSGGRLTGLPIRVGVIRGQVT